ncbi:MULTISPECIES: helix-turn-helix transcriptional regulator [unclassified Klebsiella]|uniref:helix-turn-helix transcriptional regulator n=1 Tax=unclassified Klebsiella TaxID=2608929 RepID=UPI000C2967EB|nr:MULTISPECIES: helix-turn-helix transcriptional regulator [unclassified Klebsiella]PJX44999.1 helix-turn-helix transcriptional regulator [Klebsiella sp. C-Nf10]PJX54813.1 helix-turn-helix transcriptional regulator [Klebsiella sp. D-Nf1]
MLTFLFNIKNHYFRMAIAELIHEIMNTSNQTTYTLSQQWNVQGIASANIIFTEMTAGEWYLCHDIFKETNECFKLFILQSSEQHLTTSELPNCLQSAVFIDKQTTASTLKKEITKAVMSCATPSVPHSFNRLRRCINCSCRSVSEAQLRVIYAFSIGLSPHEIAAALNISHKTIYSHKQHIMHKFKLQSQQQFNSFIQILTRR